MGHEDKGQEGGGSLTRGLGSRLMRSKEDLRQGGTSDKVAPGTWLLFPE